MTLTEQIASVHREIAMRERVYPRWVASKKMTQAKADHELAAMRAVLDTLLLYQPHERLEGALPLVLYFTNDGDRAEFIEAMAEAKPGMRSIKL